jgi:hypothetical protein
MTNSTLNALLALALAYVACALSGINEWTFIWLKSFYLPYSFALWTTLALYTITRLHTKHDQIIGIPEMVLAGYISGLIAYQMGPILRDGSFLRAQSTVIIYGPIQYLRTSATFPLLCASPLVGLIVGLTLTMITRPKARLRAAVAAGSILIAGWAFFLPRGSFPAHW